MLTLLLVSTGCTSDERTDSSSTSTASGSTVRADARLESISAEVARVADLLDADPLDRREDAARWGARAALACDRLRDRLSELDDHDSDPNLIDIGINCTQPYLDALDGGRDDVGASIQSSWQQYLRSQGSG